MEVVMTSPVQEPKIPKRPVFRIIVGLLVFLIVSLLIFVVYVVLAKNANQQPQQQSQNNNGNSDNNQEPNQPAEPTLTDFSGKFFAAKLPTGWSIKEYEFKDKPDDILTVEGTTYSGFAQLSVFDDLNNKAFSLYAVNGVGGSDLCNDYYKFADYDPAHLKKQQDDCKAAGMTDENGKAITVEVIDVKEDSEFTFLGKTIRRVDDLLYSGKLNNNLFQVDSGSSNGSIALKSLGITFKVGADTSDSYFYKISNKNLSAEKLTLLEAILESLSVKP